jgi:hypothetical protein
MLGKTANMLWIMVRMLWISANNVMDNGKCYDFRQLEKWG